MTHPQMHEDALIGPWTLEERIGRGGNGDVWRATDRTTNKAAAVKILTKIEPKAYKRFRTEVETMRKFGGIEGVVPILSSHLPLDHEEERAWYAMPLGIPGRLRAARVANRTQARDF